LVSLPISALSFYVSPRILRLQYTVAATHLIVLTKSTAMVSMAEQFGNLRQTLGSVLGIYTILRWSRTLLAKLTGRPPPADATALTPAAFASFTGAVTPGSVGSNGQPVPPRPSKKPFIVFLVAVFGLPYLMGKLIKALARNQEQAMQHQQSQIGPNGQLIGPDGQPQPRSLDPNKLDFCRVLYDYPARGTCERFFRWRTGPGREEGRSGCCT